MTFWGWILAIPLCLALLGFIIQAAEHVFDFDLNARHRKHGMSDGKKQEDDAFRVHITNTFNFRTQDPHKQD